MLEIDHLSCGYGGRALLSGISLSVAPGEMLAVLGPNGAGKTTLLSTIVGLLPALHGSISVEGVAITSAKAIHRARRHRIAWVPEGRRLFNGLTVTDNLVLGCHRERAAEREQILGEVFELFPALDALRHRDVATLSGGEQQMVAMGRALAMRPRVLLLDEPSLGLAPLIVDTIFDSLQSRLSSLAVVLVEQNVEVGLHHATHGLVLEGGRVAISGTADELRQNAAVRAAYFAGIGDDRPSPN